jgi:hypothetical protein
MGRKPSQSSLQQPKMTAQQTCRPKVEPQITGRQGWAAALKQQQAQAQLQRADGRDRDEGGGRDGGWRRADGRAAHTRTAWTAGTRSATGGRGQMAGMSRDGRRQRRRRGAA